VWPGSSPAALPLLGAHHACCTHAPAPTKARGTATQPFTGLAARRPPRLCSPSLCQTEDLTSLKFVPMFESQALHARPNHWRGYVCVCVCVCPLQAGAVPFVVSQLRQPESATAQVGAAAELVGCCWCWVVGGWFGGGLAGWYCWVAEWATWHLAFMGAGCWCLNCC
jgi:hypothetical protein